jgi:hypothetical protein
VRVAAATCAIFVILGTFARGGAGASLETPAFATAQLEWGTGVLGPDVGDVAPNFNSLQLAGQRSILVFTSGFLPSEALPFLQGWAAQSGAQLVLAAADLDVERAALTSGVTYIERAEARAALDLYRVGSAACPLLLLVDEAGSVVYREEGVGTDAGVLITDPIVLSFVDEGTVDSATLLHRILSAGEIAPWPTFALLDAAGESVTAAPGRARLILNSGYYPTEDGLPPLPAGIDALRSEFPEVEFVWLISRMSEESSGYEWDFAQSLGWAIDFPDRYGLPRSEFVASRSALTVKRLQTTLGKLAQWLPAWSVWIDVDGALEDFWSIPPMSSLTALAADGRVVLPPSPYPMLEDPETGKRSPDPRVVDELRILLREASS